MGNYSTVDSDRRARHMTEAGVGSYYQDRERQGRRARAPHGWVHGRVLVVTTRHSAHPCTGEAVNRYLKPAQNSF